MNRNNFTDEEVALIKTKIDQGNFSLTKTYSPFLVALLLSYFYAKPKSPKGDISLSQYDVIYTIVFGFFAIVFAFFAIRDYKKKVMPLRTELQTGDKKIIPFKARKYFEPIYNNYLLFHPFQEGKYLLITEEIFNNISEGDILELVAGSITGVILGMKLNGKTISSVEEFII